MSRRTGREQGLEGGLTRLCMQRQRSIDCNVTACQVGAVVPSCDTLLQHRLLVFIMGEMSPVCDSAMSVRTYVYIYLLAD